MLTLYWITFVQSPKPGILNLGCGITAQNLDEVRSLLAEKVFPIYGAREIVEITENIDIKKLDAGHVLPNMASPEVKGVWFPLLP